jgi:hypothetical protein
MTATNNAATDDTSSWYDDEVQKEQRSTNDDYDKAIQSVVRVTFAGFCGALVGMSRQHTMAGAKIFQRSVATGKPLTRAPPKLKTIQTPEDQINIPWMWAASFMVFVSILETSRFWSPTGMALKLYHQDVADTDHDPHQTQTSQQQQQQQQQPWNYQQYVVTVSDFTLGGAVAGWAGAMSKRQPLKSSSTSRLELPQAILKTGRKSILLSGIGTGIALGFMLGVCQASLDLAEEYVAIEEGQDEPVQEEGAEEHEQPK